MSKITLFFLKVIAIIFLMHAITSACWAQQAEVGVFWSKYKSSANGQQHSKIIGELDQLNINNNLSDGGGIQAAWFFNENIGIRTGLWFSKENYNLEVNMLLKPKFGVKRVFKLDDNLKQIPIGLVWRMPVFNNTRTIKLYSDLNLDIHQLDITFKNGELNHFEESSSVKYIRQLIDVEYHNNKKTIYSVGGTLGMGFTPFECKQVELNLLYSYSFSKFKVLSYDSEFTYYTQNDEEFTFPSQGTIYIKPSYFMAQLVFYVYQK